MWILLWTCESKEIEQFISRFIFESSNVERSQHRHKHFRSRLIQAQHETFFLLSTRINFDILLSTLYALTRMIIVFALRRVVIKFQFIARWISWRSFAVNITLGRPPVSTAIFLIYAFDSLLQFLSKKIIKTFKLLVSTILTIEKL